MATESFDEDMVIDTPEAAANLLELIESGVGWKRGNSVVKFVSADSDFGRRFIEKHRRKE